MAEGTRAQSELETGVQTLPPVSEAHAPARAQAELQVGQGQLIGRYMVISRLGAGAMGVVLAAYDPELDRKVAIKLLKPRGSDPAAARTRLQREAQALAKLDHRNVVSVYDVGTLGEQLFVAMEFVEGRDLGQWLEQSAEPRPWPEVLAVFEAAGRGLAAAHGAGLIHRDFKPDNVMLGDDGRVRVMDFGLARTEVGEGEAFGSGEHEVQASVPDGAAPAPSALSTMAATGVSRSEASATTGPSKLSTRLTQTGAMMGTPAYMAHEQFAGKGVDARSDQFGFCVALYEALYGERPFAGKHVADIMLAVEAEEVSPAPSGSLVPTWVRRVVVRGLAKDPAQRWPSMDALLAALRQDPAQRQRKWGLALGGVALLGGLVWGALRLAQPDTVEPCAEIGAKLDGVWDEGRRGALAGVLAGGGAGWADESWTRVEQLLDRYALEWVEAGTQACMASVRGEQSGELLDLRMSCLDERAGALAALVEELEEAGPDASVAAQAVEAASALPGLARCSDAAALRAALPPPEDPEVAARVEQLERALHKLHVEVELGRYEAAEQLLETLSSELDTLDYPPLKVRAALRQAELERARARFAAAEASLLRAYGGAVELGMREEAAKAANELLGVVGSDLGRYAEGRHWGLDADPLTRGANSPELRADYLGASGLLALQEGDYDLSREHLQGALELRRESLGPEHPKVADALGDLGSLARIEGDNLGARTYFEQVYALRSKAFGAEHPAVAIALENLGKVGYALGELEESMAKYEQALAMKEAALGPSHPSVAITLSHLSATLTSMGRPEEARTQLERALALSEAALGPNHPSVADALNNLGIVQRQLEDFDAAERSFERALELRVAQLGEDHDQVATTLLNLAQLAHSREELDRALELNARALDIRESTFGRDSQRLVAPLAGMGTTYFLKREFLASIEILERGVAITKLPGGNPLERVALTMNLANTLWDAPEGEGRDRERSVGLAEEARDVLDELGQPAKRMRDAVEGWLAEVPESL